jgi:hypothetical protein
VGWFSLEIWRATAFAMAAGAGSGPSPGTGTVARPVQLARILDKLRGWGGEERSDHERERCPFLEQEGMPGVVVEHQPGSGDQPGQGMVVGDLVQPVGGAVGNEGGDRDRGGLPAGRVRAAEPLFGRAALGRDRGGRDRGAAG